MASFRNHILVPIDFSEQSLIALGQSYNLARLTKADITLINIIEDSFHLPFFQKKEDKTLEKKISKELEKLAHETTEKGACVFNDFTQERCTRKFKKRQKTEMLILLYGHKWKCWLEKIYWFQCVLRVIRESPCQVITIKGKKHRPGCKNIVVPLDLSKKRRKKVHNAMEFAQLFGSHPSCYSLIQTDEFIVNKLKRQMQQVFNHIQGESVPCNDGIPAWR